MVLVRSCQFLIQQEVCCKEKLKSVRTKEPSVLSAPSPGPVLCEEDCFKMFLVSLLSDGGTIKDKSPTFSVSGVKGNLSYKITNTFITHLTGEGTGKGCKL